MGFRTPSTMPYQETPSSGALRRPRASARLACQSGRRASCRSHHTTRAGHRATWLHPAVASRLSLRLPLPRVWNDGGEARPRDREGSFRVFHIVSTGEPALAVQVGRLRRSPRRRQAGDRGLRFPRKQGTGLHQVIHSVSRPPAGNVPALAPAFPTFSTATRVPAGSLRDRSLAAPSTCPFAPPASNQPVTPNFSTGARPRS